MRGIFIPTLQMGQLKLSSQIMESAYLSYPEAYHALSKQQNRFVGFFSCRQICPGS